MDGMPDCGGPAMPTRMGYVTHEEYETQFSEIFDQIVAYGAGTPINVINPEALGKQI